MKRTNAFKRINPVRPLQKLSLILGRRKAQKAATARFNQLRKSICAQRGLSFEPLSIRQFRLRMVEKSGWEGWREVLDYAEQNWI